MKIKLNPSFYAKCQKGMEAMGKVVEEEMKYRVPKDTWDLWASITSDTTRVGNEIITTVKTNLGPDSYASLIEYGTVYIGVGAPDNPVTDWKAYMKRGYVPEGQTMPFARVADFVTEDIRLWAFKKEFK